MANIKLLGGLYFVKRQSAQSTAQIAEALSRRTETKLTGDKVTLVAVTKNHPVDVVLESLALGVTNIGENRVQEAKEKRTIVPDRGFWHLIGHLQTNKAKQAVTLFDLIESADSEHLLAALDKAAGQQHKQQDILLQLNIAREEQKTGFLIEDYLAILPQLDDYKNLCVRGLMVIAPLCGDIEEHALFLKKVIAVFASCGRTAWNRAAVDGYDSRLYSSC